MDLVDNGTESYVQTCSACGRTFRTSGAFHNHLRGCKPNKKRLRETLAAAKDITARKRQRRCEAATASQSEISELSQDVDLNVRGFH